MFNHLLNKQKYFLLLIAIVIFFYFIFYNYFPELIFPTEEFFLKGVKLIKDQGDFGYYWQGQVGWLKDKSLNYHPSYDSYPQLSLLIFTIPLLIANNLNQYLQTFVIFSGIGFILLVYFTFKIINLLNNQKKNYWLFLTPAFLYFCFNRYDIWPVLFLQISLYFLLKQKLIGSWLWLGTAIMTKWYAVLLIPFYLIETAKNYKDNLLIKKAFLTFLIVLFLPLITAFIFFGKEILAPYFYQLDRLLEPGNWPYILFGQILSFNLIGQKIISLILLILQFILPVYFLLKSQKISHWLVNHHNKIILFSLVIINFIFWSKFYSPQWQLWFWPLLILIADKRLIGLMISYDLINYLQFPILYSTVGPYNWQFSLIVILRNIILVIIVFYLFNLLKSNNKLA